MLQIKLLKLLRLLASGDKAASDNCAAVVSSALRRAASGGNHTIGHAIVYEAVRSELGWQREETDSFPTTLVISCYASLCCVTWLVRLDQAQGVATNGCCSCLLRMRRTITAMYPNPALLASAAEAVAVLIKSPAHNLKYCGLTALAAITR